MTRIVRSSSLFALVAAATVLSGNAAFAHVGDHAHMTFIEGLMHPLGGIDHILAMVAVGIWASQIGGRALVLLPLAFPAVMAVGAALGMGGVAMPWVETGIAASVMVLGAAIALALRPSLAVTVPVVGAFALLHGYSHGVELPADASALGFGAGFIAATVALHVAGIGLGFAAARAPLRFAAQGAGGAIAATGAMLLALPH